MRYTVRVSAWGYRHYLAWLALTWDGQTIGSPGDVYEFITAPEREEAAAQAAEFRRLALTN